MWVPWGTKLNGACVCVLMTPKSTSKAHLFHSSHRFVHSTAIGHIFTQHVFNWAHISPKSFPTKPGPPESSSSVKSISTDPAIQVKNRNSILHSLPPCLTLLQSSNPDLKFYWPDHQILLPYYPLNMFRWFHPRWHHAMWQPNKWNLLLQLSFAFYDGRRVHST